MNIPAKNGNGAVFQLSAVTLPDGSLSQAITLVDSTGAAIAAWPLSEGAATEDTLQAILAKLNGSLAVTGPLTDAQLRATALPVSGTFWQPTQPVSLAAVPLATDAATNTKLEQVRALLAAALSVNVSNFPATQAVSAAALPLPSGAATSAAQTTGNTSLASILSALQGTLAVAVQAFPSDYPDATSLAKLEQIRQLLAGTLAVSASALPLPNGAASETTLAAVAYSLTILNSIYQQEDEPANSGSFGMPMLAMRADSDAPTANDGDWTVPKLDEEGRLKVATKPASIANTVGDLAALNSAVFCNVSRASNVVFHLKNVGTATMVAGTFVFEASLDSTNGTDGTWFGVQAARSNANTAATSVAITSLAVNAGDSYAWEASVNGYKWFRVRCSVAVTASSIGRWTLQPGTYATEPLPVNQVSTVNATANIGTYGGVVYTDSSANLAISAAFTGTSRDAGSTVGYGVFAANAYADQAGTLYIEKSTDNSTWRPARQVAVAAATPVELKMLITTRYNRVRYVNDSVAQTAFLLTSTMQRI